MENFEGIKKLVNFREGDITKNLYEERHDPTGERTRQRSEKAVVGKEKSGGEQRRWDEIDNSKRQNHKVTIGSEHDIRCMYTNLDSITNKKSRTESSKYTGRRRMDNFQRENCPEKALESIVINNPNPPAQSSIKSTHQHYHLSKKPELK